MAKNSAQGGGVNSERVIDGFRRPPSKKAATKRPAPPKQAEAIHDRTARAQTLMRGGLKKPAFKLRRDIYSVLPTNKDRESRAKKIMRDPRVKRFGGFASSANSAPTSERQTVEATVRPMETASTAGSSAGTASPSPAAASGQQLERMLDEALLTAQAHKESLRQNAKPWQKIKYLSKWLSVGLPLIILAIGAVIFIWQKVPQVAIKVADSRAHIDATVPAYTPDGYKFVGPIIYANKIITVKYQSGASAARYYSITEKSSNYDSSALAANAIPANAPVQTSLVDGNTIYIYGTNNDATWVNNGIWYTITNSAGLDSDQLLKIVQSM